MLCVDASENLEGFDKHWSVVIIREIRKQVSAPKLTGYTAIWPVSALTGNLAVYLDRLFQGGDSIVLKQGDISRALSMICVIHGHSTT